MPILGILLLIVAALIAAGWVGLQVHPKPFPAYPARAKILKTVPLPADLPAPVARFFKTIIGEQIPVIDSAVITGTGKLRFMGIPFNARWRFTHCAGRDYRHYIEATIFGYPLMKVNETYLDGKSRLELPFGVVENEPKVNSAANLGMWGESIWLPTIFVTDARVRWEAIDETHARLIVPCEQGEDSFTVTFDAQTGLLRQLETRRWRDVKDTEKLGWTNRVSGWQTFDGIQIPSPAGVIWSDQGAAWLVLTVEDAAYNVDVSTSIRARGL